ncbi:MAG: DUF362 domain-containing protein [Clostridia bacterium]|nr:DUF362 domain-containing protein [Clostridia bacterium]
MTTYSNCAPVFVRRCENYNEENLCLVLKESLSALGISPSLFAGKNVLLKPNLVMAKQPDAAATTHPAFARAAARLMHDCGAASVTLADSPGGPFNEAYVSVVYNTCGMKAAAADGRFALNADFGFSEVHTDGVKLKTLNILNAVRQADVIVDLCRLKTHSLTGMSCAVKNLFGVIPGVEKFQMHSNFPEVGNFSEMLVDLAQYVTSEKTFLAVCDAVVSMEGNGPSHGIPKKTGLVLVSQSPFSLDVIGERIMFGAKSDDTAVVRHLDSASARGIMPRDWREIDVVGDTDYDVFDFLPPDTGAGYLLKNLPNFLGGKLVDVFSARPVINEKKCVGCGRCRDSCPKKTIRIGRRGEKGKRIAVILRENCIKCYCCQELCPLGAVDTKQNWLIKLIH